MTATILENITSVRASLDELETAFRAAATAVARYHELAGGLALRLGAPLPAELLALPAPIEVKAEESAPPPRGVARPKPAAKERPVREARPAPVGVTCFRAHGRDAGPCRGKVALVRCNQCDWTRALCEAHREGPRAAMVLSAHYRVEHTPKGKAALKALQRRGAAARDGRPKHRKAKAAKAAKAEKAEKERHPAPASTTVDRRNLIAQRMRRVTKGLRCLVCREPGHTARFCPRRSEEAVEGTPRPAMGALEVEGLEELDAGHTVALRAGGGVED
jgi:hypothetical protein